MVPPPDPDRVRAAEVVAALCLATDLGMGLPVEQGLQATVVAMRVAERLGVDEATARQTFFGCLLFYAGCTADAEVQAILFPEGALLERWTPVMFGSSREATVGVLTALAAGEGTWPKRVFRAAGRFPGAVIGHRQHVAALCEVTELIAAGFNLPPDVTGLFQNLTERWDGDGPLGRSRGSDLPLALRIIHVARDAVFQAGLRDSACSAEILGKRAGNAFDPDVVAVVLEDPNGILASPDEASVWDVVLGSEPGLPRLLEGAQIDDALLSAGAFADLVSPDFTGHSMAVGELAGSAAAISGCSAEESAVCPPRRLPARPGPNRCAVHGLAAAGQGRRRRLGEDPPARVPHRAAAEPVTVPGSAGVGRRLSSRAPGRQRLPPTTPRRRAGHARPPPCGSGRLPHQDRASAAPRGPHTRSGRRRGSGPKRPPGASTLTASPPSSKRQGTAPASSNDPEGSPLASARP